MSHIEFDVDEAAQLYLSGYSLSEIGRKYDCSYMTIGKRLRAHGVAMRKRGPVRTRKEDVDLEQIAHEYCDIGMTSYELGEKYSVDHTAISRWMRSLGINKGKPTSFPDGNANGRGSEILKGRCKARIEKKLADEGGVLELVGYGKRLTLRCTVCGHVFEKSKGGYQHRFTCPKCAAREIEQAAEQMRRRRFERSQQLEAAREWRGSVARICKECGDPFFLEVEGACYCSERCRNRARNRRQAESRKARGVGQGTHRRRMRVEVTPATYDRSVTLDAVYRKFNGVCCSCGRRTHRTKKYEPLQATLDHVVALANGGTHTWDNVQLLCHRCNSEKRDLAQVRLAV